jgi:hypothetical protein
MKVSKSSLVLTAAFTGLLGGTMARLNAGVSVPGASGSGMSSASSLAQSAGVSFADKKVEKHACAGKKSCKSSRSSTADNGRKGKNSCKGKGGCATDGSQGLVNQHHPHTASGCPDPCFLPYYARQSI